MTTTLEAVRLKRDHTVYKLFRTAHSQGTQRSRLMPISFFAPIVLGVLMWWAMIAWLVFK